MHTIVQSATLLLNNFAEKKTTVHMYFKQLKIGDLIVNILAMI